MTVIQQTQPVTVTQIFATIGIVATAFFGITQVPTLDATTGVIVFIVSTTVVLGILTFVGLNTTCKHSSFNQFAQRALSCLKKNRTVIVVTAFGLGASLAIGVYANALLGTLIGAMLMAMLVGLWLLQKRELARIVA